MLWCSGALTFKVIYPLTGSTQRQRVEKWAKYDTPFLRAATGASAANPSPSLSVRIGFYETDRPLGRGGEMPPRMTSMPRARDEDEDTATVEPRCKRRRRTTSMSAMEDPRNEEEPYTKLVENAPSMRLQQICSTQHPLDVAKAREVQVEVTRSRLTR